MKPSDKKCHAKFPIFPLILCLICLSVRGQYISNDHYFIRDVKLNSPTFIKYNTDKQSFSIEDAKQVLDNEVNIGTNNEFRLNTTKVSRMNSSIIHKHFKQYYKGIEVEGGEYTVHAKNGTIVSIRGKFYNNIDIDIGAKVLTEEEVLTKVIDELGYERYIWDIQNMESQKPEGKLVIIKDNTEVEGESGSYFLTYKFGIYSLIPLSSELVYADAITGSIVRKQSLIFNGIYEATVETGYSGSKTVITDTNSLGEYILHHNDPYNNVDIHTFNSIDSTTIRSDFTNDTTIWDSYEWDDYDDDWPALDAHWGASFINLHYFDSVLEISNYHDIPLYVHWKDDYENAGVCFMFTGTYNPHYIFMGDGKDVGNYDDTKPFVGLDILAHEYGHILDIDLAYLIQRIGEKAAINEGFADIWSVCVEHYYNEEFFPSNRSIWEMGEDIFENYNCTRNIQNPNALGGYGKRYPDTYQGDYWDTLGNGHINSTVLSHWFYLFIEGGSGINDNGDSFDVSGIGRDSINYSANMIYDMLDNYINGIDEYFDNVKEASIDYFQIEKEEKSKETEQAIASWYAVGVEGSCVSNYRDTTLTSDETWYVPGCGLFIDSVTIQNSGTDVVFVADSISIESEFEINNGATLELKIP